MSKKSLSNKKNILCYKLWYDGFNKNSGKLIIINFFTKVTQCDKNKIKNSSFNLDKNVIFTAQGLSPVKVRTVWYYIYGIIQLGPKKTDLVPVI